MQKTRRDMRRRTRRNASTIGGGESNCRPELEELFLEMGNPFLLQSRPTVWYLLTEFSLPAKRPVR